ncbi:hypothetical protein [Tenacibaculum agarivorans]|uniref:hypothetical protein n=1 Tax=Tenacibaculum agarivorans TaxID=1908389 RepID=UPI00094B7F11|nr:hypothetical protein [Tenacibaculum agarivorans]
MKIILIAFSLICLTNCKAKGNTENLDNETLFVLFEKSKETTKIDDSSRKNKDLINYIYSYSHENSKTGSFILSCSTFFSYDDQFKNINRSKVFTINKTFLDNNFIIDNSYIDKVGFDIVFEMLFKSKNIFVIDKSEIQGNQITLREAKLSYTAEE